MNFGCCTCASARVDSWLLIFWLHGFTFSVLMSPASSSSKVNRISLMCSRQVAVDKGQVRQTGSRCYGICV